MKTATVTVQINCTVRAAYDFIVNPRHFPQWAGAFCKSVRKVGRKWIIETPQGAMTFRYVAKNRFGVLDHYVSPQPGVEIYVPMRVVACGTKTEAALTLFRLPGMTPKRFAEDMKMVKRDLAQLKKVLEARRK